MTFIGLFLLAVSMNEYIDPLQPARPDRPLSGAGSAPVLSVFPAPLLPGPARSASNARSAPSTCQPRHRRQRDLRPRGEIEQRQTTLIKTIGQRHPARRWKCRPARWCSTSPESASTSTGVSPRELAAIRWKRLSYIMQGSMNVLNPVRGSGTPSSTSPSRHIGKPMPGFLRVGARSSAAPAFAPEVSRPIRISSPGGMRQRVTIALATVCRPEFIIATTDDALDVVCKRACWR